MLLNNKIIYILSQYIYIYNFINKDLLYNKKIEFLNY